MCTIDNYFNLLFCDLVGIHIKKSEICREYIIRLYYLHVTLTIKMLDGRTLNVVKRSN